MKEVHKQEREQFKSLFKENIDHFEERYAILNAFLQTEGHLTETELIRLIKQKNIEINPKLVKDTLKLMCDFGFATKNSFQNGTSRYEPLHPGLHHDHIICTKCRNIIEFKDDFLEDLQIKIAKSYGFHILQHKMEIYGICRACLEGRGKQISLSLARPGEDMVIKKFLGGRSATSRLMSMGLRPGDRISVISNVKNGQVVLALSQRRYAIGYGLAQKILVETAA